MKKITVLFSLIWTLWGYSQVKNYTFTQSIGTYEELSDGTVLGNEYSDDQRFIDPAVPLGNSSVFTGVGFPIGFNFIFNGYVYDRFAISNDGWISLGSSSSNPAIDSNIAPVYGPISSTGNVSSPLLSSRIAALAKNLIAQAGSSLSFKTITEITGKVLVVQWKKYRKAGSAGVGDEFNFQIRIHENLNTVKVVYGNFTTLADAVQTFQVGLRAEPALNTVNFNNRKSSPDWANSTAGTAADDIMSMTKLSMPFNGLTYIWTPASCGESKSLVVNSITTDTANLNWGSYTPAPNSYEYIVSASATLPLPTAAGTATTNPTAALTGLNPNTVYNVFLHSKCGAGYTPWILSGTFKTLCADIASLYEDFDSYDGNANSIMPDCWETAGTGTTYITKGSLAPMSPSNKLYMYAVGTTTAPTVAYALMPSISDLAAGGHRVRFTAYCSEGIDRILDVGYFETLGNLSTFKLLGSVTVPGTAATAKQFTVTFGALPEVKRLVLRNNGTKPGTNTIYIDDISCEPTPTCADISAVAISAVASTSAKLSWTKGATETEWQYVCIDPTVLNPASFTPTTYSGAVTSLTIPNLLPATKYRVWMRSKCGSDFGAWINSAAFTTTCVPANQIVESFDGSTSNALPACWTKIGADGNILINNNNGTPSFPNSLDIYNSASATNYVTIALPPVTYPIAGNYRLRFKAKGQSVGYTLDIGYLDDISNSASYQFLQTVTMTSNTVFNEYILTFGSDLKSPYLVIRNSMAANRHIYIDDVVWEPLPQCSDVYNVNLTAVTGSTATFSWTAGTQENAWQYVIGNSSTADPNSLTPVNATVITPTTPVTTATGLTSSTTYRAWVRSKCTSSFGAWKGPIIFTTSCASGTSFTQNFDVNTVLPACWTKVGTVPAALVTIATATDAPSGPNVLSLKTTSSPAVCAMPPVNNAGEGTYRLKFKVKSDKVGGVLKVGYLNNFNNPDSFVALDQFTYTAAQNTAYENKVCELGTEPASDMLAFVNTGTSAATIYIDDVAWEKITTCKKVSALKSTNSTSSSVSFAWTAGGSETKWEYVYGAVTVSDPNSLTPIQVTSPLATIINLSPTTSYKIWVRSKCTTDTGEWSDSILVNTTCPDILSITENFDSSTAFPSCWKNVSGITMVSTLANTPSKSNALTLFSSPTSAQSVVAMPPLGNINSGYEFKFKYAADRSHINFDLGYLTNIADSNSFVLIKMISADTNFAGQTITLGSNASSNVLAFRYTGEVAAFIYIDDVSWKPGLTAVPACVTAINASVDANCGNLATVISWPAVANADGYYLTVGTTSGASDVADKIDVVGTTFSVTANANTTYYYTVKPYNSVGTAQGCTVFSYTTNANKCYCTSVPSNKDVAGVTGVKLGASNFAGNNLTYYDFTSIPVNLVKGKKADLNITFSISNAPYKTNVYIDYNDNYNFESSEIVYSGTLGPIDLSSLDASFFVSDLANPGMHRMRIATWSSLIASPSVPCYNGGLAVTLDFKVNIITAPVANDEPAKPTALIVGSDFNTNAITGTNVNSTGSTAEMVPSCGNYNGMDVWYSAVVPASGKLTFEVNTVAGGITNTAAAAYSGTPAFLTLFACDDSSSVTTGDQPKINLTGRTPGEVIYFRVWSNGAKDSGTFKVSAYEAMLGTESFDNINFSFYPNPVTNVLNLSFGQEVNTVTVMNLLGQQVISKSINANEGKVDMSELSAGTYLIKVAVGNQIKTIKVIKE